jgi:hypothetical protein
MLHEYHVIQYIRSVLSAVSCNRGRSWNILPANSGALLYSGSQIQATRRQKRGSSLSGTRANEPLSKCENTYALDRHIISCCIALHCVNLRRRLNERILCFVGRTSQYRVIQKSVKHFKNSQQIDYATDHGNSYADRERKTLQRFLKENSANIFALICA